MKPVRRLGACVAAVALITGCSYTKCKLSGTQGAHFKGYYRTTDQADRQSDSGKLPSYWFALACGFYRLRLEECEYQKQNTNDSLVLKVRTPGFKGTITAPPGTEGVRVIREGKKYRTETF